MFLQVRYCEIQVDSYGKKGMILLVNMEIRWKIDGEFSVFEYSFVDFESKGYSGQYH